MSDGTGEMVSVNYRLLLKEATLLYKEHEAGRPQPFNVFSVLRSESDEVNLHSRFLHALLDYKKPGKETRENLSDFLQRVGMKGFEEHGVKVERERDNIDILITNDAGQAVVVENKIWSGDQPEQLQRYHDTLKGQGYAEIHLLYLTPYGDNPSEDSVGSLPCKAISYRDTLPLWLERCQQRSYDEPELRESVAQYRHLVQKLTGTDYGRAYMNALEELCLKGENPILIHDLYEAMITKLPDLVLSEIDAALREDIPCLRDAIPPDKDKGPGLYYPLDDEAFLGVSTYYVYLGFGVYCENLKHPKKYESLSEALKNVSGGKSTEYWAWWCQEYTIHLRTPGRESLTLLSNGESRKKYGQEIARRLKPVWNAIKAAGLAGQDA